MACNLTSICVDWNRSFIPFFLLPYINITNPPPHHEFPFLSFVITLSRSSLSSYFFSPYSSTLSGARDTQSHANTLCSLHLYLWQKHWQRSRLPSSGKHFAWLTRIQMVCNFSLLLWIFIFIFIFIFLRLRYLEWRFSFILGKFKMIDDWFLENYWKFLKLDTVGVITMEELAAVIHSLNERPSKEEIQEMINEVDSDGSGTVHFDDFLNIMARKLKVNFLVTFLFLLEFGLNLHYCVLILWKFIPTSE